MKIGVVVGRFQVDDLHEGHIKLLDTANEENDHLVVFIGTCVPKLLPRNPLSFAVRYAMIAERYPYAAIFEIRDNRSDKIWSRKLDSEIKTFLVLNDPGRAKECTLYHSRDSFKERYSGSYPTKEVEETPLSSGTELRRRINAGEFAIDASYRRGWIAAANHRYDSVWSCVDIAVFNHKTKCLLLARKPGEEGWRFPGGFVDKTDFSFKFAAQRELKEETGLSISVDNMEVIDSFRIDDWRYRGSDKDTVMTTLFWADYDFHQQPVATDDIVEVRWFTFGEVYEMAFPNALVQACGAPDFIVMPEHIRLLSETYNYWVKNIDNEES